jgi:RsiW-degrading membrane proteinase PrsW (M82 family)
MNADNSMNRRLRGSGILVIVGLSVEALCLVWSRPIAFVVLVCIGGALIGLGVLFFLYSLVSASPQPTEPSGLAHDKE